MRFRLTIARVGPAAGAPRVTAWPRPGSPRRQSLRPRRPAAAGRPARLGLAEDAGRAREDALRSLCAARHRRRRGDRQGDHRRHRARLAAFRQRHHRSADGALDQGHVGQEGRSGAEAARPRGRSGARLHGSLEPPGLRALRAATTSSARWATSAHAGARPAIISRRSTGSARSCARSARRRRRSRPSSSCSTSTPTGRAPSRPSRSSSARSTARAFEGRLSPGPAIAPPLRTR